MGIGATRETLLSWCGESLLETISRVKREYHFQPMGPYQRWHTDVMYV